MSNAASIKQDFIQDFGEAYRHFGLSRLMGRIVGLLLFEDGPQSLTDVTEKLRVSKGPVSQIMRRLQEKGLVRKIWVPGSRRDHYEAEPDIFGQAFENHIAMMKLNLTLALKYRDRLQAGGAVLPGTFVNRVEEMSRFYGQMATTLDAFLEEWRTARGEESGEARNAS